jgi:putative salt-induced outer membrane protein YdiY
MRGLTLILLPGVLLQADQIVMKNGDRYSGRLEKMEDGKVRFAAEYAGTIQVPWDAVEEFHSFDTFVVELKHGGIESAPAERVLALRGELSAVRTVQEQDRRLQQMQRANMAIWMGNADLGMSLSRGNAEASTFSASINTSRTTRRGKLAIYGASLYSRSEREGEKVTAANLRRGGLRYDANFNPKQFMFFQADLDHNPVQNLNLRSVLGTGFGHHLIATPRNTIDLFAGGSFNREQFTSGELRLAGEALISEATAHKLNHAFSLNQKFAIYPNVTEPGAYRMTFDGSAITSIMRWLSWQITVSNRYISNPPVGTRPNDLLVTTGFRVNFGAKQ